MAFTVYFNDALIDSYSTFSGLMSRMQSNGGYGAGVKYFHETKAKKVEFTSDQLFEKQQAIWDEEIAKKAETHKRIYVPTGVTGLQKKAIWVSKSKLSY